MAPVVRRAGSTLSEPAFIHDTTCDNLDMIEDVGSFVRLWFTIPQVDLAERELPREDQVVLKLLIPKSRRLEIARMLLSDFPVEIEGPNIRILPVR
jgi:hypothetical protein